MSNIKSRILYGESANLSRPLSAPAIITGSGVLVGPRDKIVRSFIADRARRGFTVDMQTYDQLTIDSTGAFLVGELERLDQTLHAPLVAVTWGRDITLREDVTIADEVSSFTNSSFASSGGITPSGKAWAGKDTTAITGIALDIGKTTHPLYLWDMEIKYSLPELASAEKLGRPVDAQKHEGMRIKYQMDIDEMVYTGDTFYNQPGLFNANSLITPYNVAAGASGSTNWSQKTPDEILADINLLLNTTWQTAGWAVMPGELRLPPTQFSYLVSQKVSNAGNVSILEYVRNNSLTNVALGRPLNIQPVKWLTGLGTGGTNRMVAYTNDKDRVRYPLVPLQRTPIEFRGLYQITTYYGRLGVVEFVYPETIGYADGI